MLYLPTPVRGYVIQKEAGKLMSLSRTNAVYGWIIRLKAKRSFSPNTKKKRFRHSLCWWTAHAIGLDLEGVQELNDATGNQDLSNLHT
ncbi:Uncharacterized protein HZ326_7624 [Fusarium oxysporum f. sp. albedinis]|nr:Uncharacterized protein HZ326_7624 [Fusarium oxysporum f. sp. albedinis]